MFNNIILLNQQTNFQSAECKYVALQFVHNLQNYTHGCMYCCLTLYNSTVCEHTIAHTIYTGT